MFLPFPAKPKGMHWLTYQRLRREEAEANAQLAKNDRWESITLCD
jgi:hypothetical protein